MITKLKLDRLAGLQAQEDLLRLKKQELINEILTAEIKEQINAVEVEFEPEFQTINNNIDVLSKAIKEEVIGLGESVKGSVLQAVYAKGRVTWDNKGLGGYVISHPELNQFKKVGDPSVSIRKVG